MKILFLGHSLVAFYDWQRRFPGHSLVNMGIAGESVEGLLARLDRVIGAHREADVIFIMTGANNVVMGDLDILPPYRRILRRLRSSYPASDTVIHTMFPLHLEGIRGEDVEAVNDKLLSLARQEGVEVIDLYEAFRDERGRQRKEYFTDDGVHLSEKGYALWSQAVEDFLLRRGGPQPS